MTEQELNLVQLAANQMAQARARPSEVVRRQLLDIRASRASPDDVPEYRRRHAVALDPTVLLIARKTAPCVMPVAVVHASIDALTQAGTGTVRMRPPLPTRSAMTLSLSELEALGAQVVGDCRES